MESKKFRIDDDLSAFDLPRMLVSPFNPCTRAEVVEGLKNAKYFHATYIDKKDKLHVLASGYAEKEFDMRMAAAHRSRVEYEFTKSIILTVDDFREKPLTVANEIMHQRVEYLVERSKTLFL